MSENSSIEWTDHTFNPWIGCTKVSPGCAHCYAETQDNFRKWTPEGWGKGKPRRRTAEANWNQVRKWNRDAERRRVMELHSVPAGQPHKWQRPRVFCASLADWLDDEVPIEWLKDLLCLIAECPALDFQLLTKRPENFRSRIEAVAHGWESSCQLAVWWARGIEPPNVWLGTTCEDQARADLRIPHLLKIPARVRFLSCEPLLGPVNLPLGSHRFCPECRGTFSYGDNGPGIRGNSEFIECDQAPASGIHWVIAGGESGPGARPMHPDWALALRDQCQAAGVPFLFKQWGEFQPGLSQSILDDPAKAGQWTNMQVISSTDKKREGCKVVYYHDFQGRAFRLDRPGKKAAGRLLQGRTWDEFPKLEGSR
jgi:protein gp37